MSRSRHAARTFGASLLATISGVLVGLFSTPLLLRWLGDERVGTYRVAAEWLAYLSLLDFGVTGAAQVALARAVGAGDRRGVGAIVRVAAGTALRLAGVMALVTVGFAVAAPYLVSGLSDRLTSELRFGLLLGLVGLVWVPLAVFRPLADVMQRGYLVHAAFIAQSWVTTGLSLGFAAGGGGLPGQFLAVALGNGIGALALARYGLRRYPEILTRPDAAAAIPATFSWLMLAFNLGSRLGLHSDAIVVGLVVGPEAVVAFVVTQRLLMLVDSQVMALGTAAWPPLADLSHKGDSARFGARLTQLTRWTGVLGIGLGVPTAALTPAFVSLWVGGERYGGDLLTVFTLAYLWLHVLIGLWGWPLVMLGRLRRFMPSFVVGTTVNLAVSVAGSVWFGVAGPAIGSVVAFALIYSWWHPLLLRREFGVPLRALAASVVRPVATGLPFAVAVFLLAGAYPLHELAVPIWARWAVLIGAVGAAAAAYLALAWFFVLPREDRNEFREKVFGR